MHSDPIADAKIIFDESLGSMMAHTIRGTQNYFRRHQLSLELSISADTKDLLALTEPRVGVTSILKTRLIKTATGVPDVVKAGIYLHKEANRTLARVSVAHEIFHLLLELRVFITTQRKAWQPVGVTKLIEDQCNQFAWELCRMHNQFNLDDEARKKFILFPEKFFDTSFNTRVASQDQWPAGMALDPAHPFTEKPEFKNGHSAK